MKINNKKCKMQVLDFIIHMYFRLCNL